jgi:uncharacterized protein (DUF2147 family)
MCPAAPHSVSRSLIGQRRQPSDLHNNVSQVTAPGRQTGHSFPIGRIEAGIPNLEESPMSITTRAMRAAIAAAAALGASSAFASANPPAGIWYDHTGRGAIEITDCGGRLCGRLVWLKDASNGKACGTQIIGNAKPVGPGKWDRGWIYDPEAGSRYDVEITPLGSDRLKVMGYAGSKFLSETMIWRRAPADLKRCTSA